MSPIAIKILLSIMVYLAYDFGDAWSGRISERLKMQGKFHSALWYPPISGLGWVLLVFCSLRIVEIWNI